MQWKISKPELSEYFLHRKRLENKFLKSKKFIYVQGEAGAGKTMLVSAAVNAPFVWITLDQDDNEFSSFLNALLLSIKYNLHLKFSPESIMESSDKFSTALNTIFKILNQNDKQIKIVLDNLHSINELSETYKFIEKFFRYAPDNTHFIFTSRATMPAFILRYVENGTEINSKEIAFNREEIKEFLHKLKVKETYAENIYEITNGWTMGVVLLAHSIKNQSKINKNYTFQFLLEEIFEKLNKKDREFLLKTSLLDSVNPDDVEEFFGIKNAEAILEKFVKKGLFISKTEDSYTYHSLFREFLRKKVEEELNVKKIQKNLGEFYLNKGKIKKALKQFVASKDKRGIIKTIKSASPYELITCTETATKAINLVCKKIPKDPDVAMILGTLYFLGGNKEKSLLIYEQSELKNTTFNGLVLLKWRLLAEEGKYKEIIEEYNYFKKDIDLLEDSKKIDFLYYVAVSNYYEGNETVTKKLIDKMYSISLRNTENTIQFMRIANAYCIINYHNKGKFKKAIKTYKKILLFSEKSNIAVNPLILSNLSLVESLSGLLESANKHSATAIKMAEESRNARALKFAEIAYAHYLIAAREPMDSIELFTKYIDEENPYLRASAYYGLSNAYRQLNKLKEAEYFARSDLAVVGELKNNMVSAQSYINLGIVLIAKKEMIQAEKTLKKAVDFAKKSKNIFELARALLFYSIALIHNKKPFEADLKAAEEIIMDNSFFFFIKKDAAMIYPYLRKAKEDTFISIVESHFAMSKVELITLGEFKILLNGKDITKAILKRQKGKKIFEYIVSKLPTYTKIDEILDTFFNSDNSKKARHNVFTLISMIRKGFENIGVREIILRDSESYSINLNVASVDFIEFEKLISQGSTERNIAKLEKAISMYGDDFLKDMLYEDWPITKREILLGKYLFALSKAAELSIENEKKILYLTKILQKDPVNDEATYRIMKLYESEGKTKEAIEAFKKYSKIFKEEYDLTPSKKALALFKEISPKS